MAPTTIDTAGFSTAFDAIVDNIETVIKGKTEVVRLALVAILCEGHILFEDVPGTGKTMLARAIAQSINATSSRVQCTPDMLPGDITGSSIFDQTTGRVRLPPRPGVHQRAALRRDQPGHAQDPVGPARGHGRTPGLDRRRRSTTCPGPSSCWPPRTPSSWPGRSRSPRPSSTGSCSSSPWATWTGPASSRSCSTTRCSSPSRTSTSVIDTEQVRAMIEYASKLEVSPEVGYYIVDLVHASRKDPSVAMGGSPRASIALLRAARCLAASRRAGPRLSRRRPGRAPPGHGPPGHPQPRRHAAGRHHRRRARADDLLGEAAPLRPGPRPKPVEA